MFEDRKKTRSRRVLLSSLEKMTPAQIAELGREVRATVVLKSRAPLIKSSRVRNVSQDRKPLKYISNFFF